MIEGHGDDQHNYNIEIKSNFSSNIFSRQDISDVEQHLAQHLHLIHSYPEPDARSLQHELAKHHHVKTDQVLATNGATEAIYLVARAFFGAHSAILAPTFSEYADGCRANNHSIRYIFDLDEIANDDQIVWLCNPNNPDGRVIAPEKLREVIAHYPNTIFVIDHSYQFFTLKESEVAVGDSFPTNLIEIHSMTKKYAIPGLRLGYLVASAELIKKIIVYKMPWSVNALAVEAGLYLLSKKNDPIDIKQHIANSMKLRDALSAIEGLEIMPSKTHFFLCRLPRGKSAAELKEWLVHNYGILIRDASNFEGLDERYFRIASQTVEENNELVKAIREWMHF